MFDRIGMGLWWDRTWSLVEGCSKVSRGCDNCWSEKNTVVRSGQVNKKMQARYGELIDEKKSWNGAVRMMWNDLNKPTPKQKPAVWSVWNDLFHGLVEFNFQYKAFERMMHCPQHFFIVCTKRATNIERVVNSVYFHLRRNYADVTLPLANVMVMVTVEEENVQYRVDRLRAAHLRWRGLSCEPLLGPLDLNLRGIHWVIAGAESGAGRRRSKLEWFQKIQMDCEWKKIPFFCKQMDIDGELAKAPVPGWMGVPEVG